MNDERALVSIIIPTYNSAKTLPRCLESIKKQSYKNIEIIIVDNFSNDNTVEIAKRYDARVVQVKSERTKAKNIGLRLANGKYVLFIDADMELTPRVIEECVQVINTSSKIAGIIIPERSVGNNYWSKVRDYERSFYIGTPIESPRFFLREIALKVGGYDEDLIFYEEATLPYKIEQLGYYTRARIKSYIIHHEEDFELAKWIRKKFYYGKTLKNYCNKYKNKYEFYVSFQVKPSYRLALFIRNKRFWTNLNYSLGLIYLKFLEFISIKLGELSSVNL